jgi:hypothetical protein
MDLADAVRQLKPDVTWKGVRPEGGRVDIEDGSPFAGDPVVLPSGADGGRSSRVGPARLERATSCSGATRSRRRPAPTSVASSESSPSPPAGASQRRLVGYWERYCRPGRRLTVGASRSSGAACILPSMRYLRQSRLPAPILGLLFGFALLGPELGHTRAHREHAPQAIVYSPHDHAVAEPEHAHADVQVGDFHATDAHAHFDLRSSPSSKPSLTLVAAVWTAVHLRLDLWDPPSFPPTSNVVILWDRYHGPPPPSRAPPLS